LLTQAAEQVQHTTEIHQVNLKPAGERVGFDIGQLHACPDYAA
jgi:hypothetical protein